MFSGQLHGTCILSEEGKQASMANAAEQQPLLGNLLVTGAMTYHTSLKLQLDTLIKQPLQPLVEQSIVPISMYLASEGLFFVLGGCLCSGFAVPGAKHSSTCLLILSGLTT